MQKSAVRTDQIEHSQEVDKMKDGCLFPKNGDVKLMPPCSQTVPSSIRGFPLPKEYAEFISNHDGAHVVYDRSDLDLDELHFVLFSLNDILDGGCYQDSCAGYLGSELSMRDDFQDVHLNVRATANGTPYDEAQKLYQKFYQNYLVFGYTWSYWDKPIRWISLFGIDRDGTYIMSDDYGIEHGFPVAWRGTSLRKLFEEARNV